MPTTASGTAYTIYSTTLDTHGDCYWGVPDALVGSSNLKTLLFCHGAGASADHFSTIGGWAQYRNWLIDNGFCWIEGAGGGERSWGNPAARAAYLAYVDHVGGILDLGDIAVMGRSMGGLVSAWLTARSTLSSQIIGWINNSGVSTLFTGTYGDPDPALQPSAQYFTLRTAYADWGATNYSTLVTVAADHAPENWDASVWAGKKILQLYGTEDTTVPWYPRGASALRTIWAGQPALDLVSPFAGGHSDGSKQAQIDTMTGFLTTVFGIAPPEVDEGSYTRIVSANLYHSGRLYPYGPKPLEVPPV